MPLDTQGDTSITGMMGNTKPNLVPPASCWYAINKRFINGQISDRGGHFCSMLLNTLVDNSLVPVPKPTIYGTIEYAIPNLQSSTTTTAMTPKTVAGIVFCSTNAYIVIPGTNAQIVSYPAGFSLSGNVFALQANNIVYLFPGQGITPIQFDPTSTNSTIFTSVPPNSDPTSFESIAAGKHALWFNNRMFVLDDDTVHISNINDPTTYDPLNDQPIERGTNDTGTALYKWNSNTIIIFKQRSVYYLAGIDDTLQNLVLDSINTEIGCISTFGVVNTKSEMYFFSGDAVYTITQAESNQLQAERVNFADPVMPFFGQLNNSYATGVTMTIYNNRLFMAIPVNGSLENNAVLVYNFINQAWEGMDQSPTTTDLTYLASVFNVQSWLYLPFLGKLYLFAVSKAGYIFLYDYDECDMTDTVSALSRYPATSNFISRGLCGSQQDFYGQTYGAGAMNKFAEQLSFHLQILSPNYTVSVLNDRAFDMTTFLSNQTYDRTVYSQWRKSNWNPTNVNNDFNLPNRNDYSVNLLASSGMYLAPSAPATGGVFVQQRQSYSIPFKVYGEGAYFMLQFQNTGGNTIISNIEVSSLTKENTFSRDS